MDHDVLVVGQVARDLVLALEEMPPPQGSTVVSQRHEMLGGKGTNQAVGLRQRGGQVAWLGVVGAGLVGQQWLAAPRGAYRTSHARAWTPPRRMHSIQGW